MRGGAAKSAVGVSQRQADRRLAARQGRGEGGLGRTPPTHRSRAARTSCSCGWSAARGRRVTTSPRSTGSAWAPLTATRPTPRRLAADALTTVTIGGTARRGVSLRAPGSVRCGGLRPERREPRGTDRRERRRGRRRGARAGRSRGAAGRRQLPSRRRRRAAVAARSRFRSATWARWQRWSWSRRTARRARASCSPSRVWSPCMRPRRSRRPRPAA